MEGADQGDLPPEVLLAAQSGDGLGGGKQSLGGASSQSTDYRGSDGLQLSKQEGTTGLYLILKGSPVAGRAALNHVADIDFGAFHADGSQQLLEELARSADKRPTQAVLVKTGCFADEHDLGMFWPFPGNGIAAPFG